MYQSLCAGIRLISVFADVEISVAHRKNKVVSGQPSTLAVFFPRLILNSSAKNRLCQLLLKCSPSSIKLASSFKPGTLKANSTASFVEARGVNIQAAQAVFLIMGKQARPPNTSLGPAVGLSQQPALIKATVCVIEMLRSIKSLNPTDLAIRGLNLNAKPRMCVHSMRPSRSPASTETGPA